MAVRSAPTSCGFAHGTQKEAECCNECQVALLVQLLHEAINRETGRFRGIRNGMIVFDFAIGKSAEGVVEVAIKLEKSIPFDAVISRKVSR
jgi:hypothetical protein